MSDMHMPHKKMSAFVSFPLFEFTLAIKLRNLDFENHWKTWIVYDKKKYGFWFEYAHGKMSDFVSFPLFGFTLVIKLRNFNFEVIKIV